MKKLLFVFFIYCVVNQNIHAEVSSAYVSAQYDWKEVGVPHSESLDWFNSMGISTHDGAGYLRFGNSVNGPFIRIHGETQWGDHNEQLFSPVNASVTMFYEWKITSKDGSQDPVLVHVHTEGYIISHYYWKAFEREPFSDNYYNVFPSGFGTSAAVGVLFENEGHSAEKYGIWSGTAGWGDRIPQVRTEITNDRGNQVIFGSITSFGRFEENLDFWITPDTTNLIVMYASGADTDGLGSGSLYGVDWIDFDAYIDPVITIDPAYADRYTLEVSYIPYVPVPEPESYLLLLAGLGVIFSFARRNNQLS